MDYVVFGLLFVLGACVGSFLNVVVLRYGYRERGGERSHCMSCNATLRAYDLVPIISYLALRGRCRQCGSALLSQYPLVEVASGLLFVLTAFVTAGFMHPMTFVSWAGFWITFLALVVYDVRHTLIPLPFAYALYGWAFLCFALAPSIGALYGAVACAGFFALLYVGTRGRGMGLGDAYVAGAIGLALGLEAGVVASVFAIWIGALVGVALISVQYVFKHLLRTKSSVHVTLRTEIPFAPFLAIGALIVWCFGIGVSALGL